MSAPSTPFFSIDTPESPLDTPVSPLNIPLSTLTSLTPTPKTCLPLCETPATPTSSKFPSPSPLPSPLRIPLPSRRSQRNHSFCYHHYILPDDQADFAAAKLLVRELLPKVLDIKFTWGQQRPGLVDELLSSVLSAYPTFEKYEQTWPLRFYSSQIHCQRRTDVWRSNYRAQSERRRKIRSSSCVVATRNTIRNVLPIPIRERVASSVRTATSPPTFSSTQCTLVDTGESPTSTEIISDSPANSNLRFNSSNVPSTCRCPLSSQTVSGQDEVVSFLRSIDSAFERLLDRFVSAGINNRTRMAAVSRWAEGERSIFLRCEVRLDPFECKLVCVALDKMIARPEVRCNGHGAEC